jgi:hypothetical protein
MLNIHQLNRVGHTGGFVPVCRQRAACSHGAKLARAGANVAQYHKRCGTCAPALAHVWAVAALANGVQLIVIDNLSYFSITFTNWKFHSQPIWTFLSLT